MARLSRNAFVSTTIAAMAVVALFGWFLLRPGQSKTRPRGAAAADRTNEPPTRPEPSVVPDRPSSPPLPAAKSAIAIPQPTAPASSTAASAKPRSALQAAFEREVPDSTSARAEDRIRAIFKEQPSFDVVFRHVLCTRSVCRLDLRWSPELSDAYNGGLIKVVEEFSREITFEPDGQLDMAQMPIPMNIYVARKGHSVESLLAEEAAAAR
jgi:hypothetical protein